jgi:hypothetical protein
MTEERMYAITSSQGHQKGGGEGVKWEKGVYVMAMAITLVIALWNKEVER